MSHVFVTLNIHVGIKPLLVLNVQTNQLLTLTITCKIKYISTYNTFTVYFHRPTFPPIVGLIKMLFSQYTLWHRYINIYRYLWGFLVLDKMSLSVLELLQPPWSQSLVDGFSLAGAEVVGAAGRWRLGGREGAGGRDPGVDGAVGGVLRLELCLCGACDRGGRGGYEGGAGGGE